MAKGKAKKPGKTKPAILPGGDRFTRAFVTPEGIDLRLQIADAGQRAGAFMLDALIIVVTLTVLTIGALVAAGQSWVGGEIERAEMVAVIWLLIAFVLRSFYFTVFELSARAATPGKRIMGIRVAARDGGRLRAEAVFARNAMRELEVFLPLSIVFGGAGGGWLSYVLAVIWAGIFLFLPLFNRDRLRAGDIVGGTWVVRAPRQKLAGDMADGGAERLSRYEFTPAQLNAYGTKELQVLEDVLRQKDRATMRAVTQRITAKIDWPSIGVDDHHDFLSAYYAGLRGRLEQRLLLGVRRRDKHDV